MIGHLLIIDDERYAVELIRHTFVRHGLPTMIAHTATTAYTMLQSTQIALVLLDIALPDASGLDFCRWLRQHDPQAAIVIMSGYSDMQVQLAALAAGADDFVTKPLVIAELFARVQAVLRHRTVPPPVILTVAGMTLQPLSGHLSLPDGTHVQLHPSEAQLMAALFRHVGQMLSYTSLAATLWPDQLPSAQSLQAIDRNLRRIVLKIERDSTCVRYLQVIPGRGARILVPHRLATFVGGRLPQ